MKQYLTKRNLIIAALIVAVFFWWWTRKNQADDSQEVRDATVIRGDVVYALSVAGKVIPRNGATLNFSSPGKVAYLGVSEGDVVKKYQLLSYLDMGDLDAAATRAYYAYLSADAAAKKVEDDMKNKESTESFAEKSIRVSAQTSRDIAYDTWLTAQRAVRNSRLVAPFAGVVTNITFSSVGDTASVTDGITVVDPGSLFFLAEVDEQDVGKVSIGQKVKMELDAFEDQVFEGIVDEIGFSAGLSSTGATVFPVKIKFENEMVSKLRVGMNGDAEIILEVRSGVLKLPYEAVIDDKVWVLDGDKEIETVIKTGVESETEVEILEGLSEGEKVRIK